MQAVEFSTKLNKDNSIDIPANFKNRLKLNQILKVIILIEDEEENQWRKLSAESFLEGYAESDSICAKFEHSEF